MPTHSEAASRVVRFVEGERQARIETARQGRVSSAFAGTLRKYLGFVARTAELEAAESFEARLATLSSRWRDRRHVFYYWNQDAFCLLLHEYCRGGAFARGVPVLCDESLGADVTANVLAGLGRETRMLHWSDAVSRVSDLQAIVRGKDSLALAVDGHGPYGEVRPGFARLMDRLQAVAVPVACRANRSWSIRMRATFALPRRGTRLALAIGEPFVPTGDPSERRVALQSALEQAGLEAEAALASRR